MAGEIQAPYALHGKTLYAIVRNSIAQAWRTDTHVFEAYTTANLANYTVSLVEQGTASQYYVGTFPTQITSGIYSVVAYMQVGGSAAEGDTLVSTGNIDWNGTVVNSLNAVTLTGDLSATMKTSVQTAADAAITANATIIEINADADELITTIGAAGAGLTAITGARLIYEIRNGTAQAGAAGSITLDSGASATDNLYRDERIVITSGTGVGQSRLITGYTGSTKVATVAPNWITNPDATSVFTILPGNKVSGVTLVDTLTTYTGNTPQTGDAFARLGAPAGASIAADLAEIEGETDLIVTATNTGVAPGASGGIAIVGSNMGTVTSVTGAVGSVTAAVTVGGYSSGQDIATRRGTAQAGAAGTITLDAGASATDHLYERLQVAILSGTGAGQSGRIITGYVGSTKVATTTPNWTTNPDSTSVFALLPAAADIETILNVASFGQAGYVGIDWGHVFSPTTTVVLANTTIGTLTTYTGNTPQTGDSFARLGAPAGASIAADIAEIEGETDLIVTATNTGVAPGAAGGLFIAGSNAATTVNFTGNLSGSVGSVTAAVTLSAGDSPVMQSGTATAGGASTITIQTALGNDSLPVGCKIKITGGTGADQCRVITAYVNSTKVVTVDRAWTTNPDATSVYSILYDDLAATNSSLQVVSSSVQGNVTGSVASVTGAVGSVTAAVTLPSIPANWITAAGINAAALNGKGDWLLATSYPANFGSMSITVGGAVTVGTNNDKTGYALSSAGLDSVLIESGISAGSGLTNDAGSQLTSINARQGISLAAAASAGVIAGAAGSDITIKPAGIPAGNTRIESTAADSNGNRPTIVLKVPT